MVGGGGGGGGGGWWVVVSSKLSSWANGNTANACLVALQTADKTPLLTEPLTDAN